MGNIKKYQQCIRLVVDHLECLLSMMLFRPVTGRAEHRTPHRTGKTHHLGRYYELCGVCVLRLGVFTFSNQPDIPGRVDVDGSRLILHSRVRQDSAHGGFSSIIGRWCFSYFSKIKKEGAWRFNTEKELELLA